MDPIDVGRPEAERLSEKFSMMKLRTYSQCHKANKICNQLKRTNDSNTEQRKTKSLNTETNVENDTGTG